MASTTAARLYDGHIRRQKAAQYRQRCRQAVALLALMTWSQAGDHEVCEQCGTKHCLTEAEAETREWTCPVCGQAQYTTAEP